MMCITLMVLKEDVSVLAIEILNFEIVTSPVKSVTKRVNTPRKYLYPSVISVVSFIHLYWSLKIVYS